MERQNVRGFRRDERGWSDGACWVSKASEKYQEPDQFWLEVNGWLVPIDVISEVLKERGLAIFNIPDRDKDCARCHRPLLAGTDHDGNRTRHCDHCYDGAPDASAFRHLIGRGKTDADALADWWEQYEELGD